MAIALGIGSLALSAVGLGMQYNAQRQAAASSRVMADYNYQLAKQQAEVQAALMQQEASQNASLLEYQAAIQQRNASALQSQAANVLRGYGQAADTTKKAGVLEVNKDREAARRFLALQMAKVGESGTTGAGSNLDVLAEAAGTLELRAQEMWTGIELETRKLHDIGEAQAYELRNASTQEGMRAGMTLFQAANARWKGATAETGRRLAMYGADVERIGGYNQAEGYKLASYGTLFSGLSSMAGAGYSLYNSGAFTNGAGGSVGSGAMGWKAYT